MKAIKKISDFPAEVRAKLTALFEEFKREHALCRESFQNGLAHAMRASYLIQELNHTGHPCEGKHFWLPETQPSREEEMEEELIRGLKDEDSHIDLCRRIMRDLHAGRERLALSGRFLDGWETKIACPDSIHRLVLAWEAAGVETTLRALRDIGHLYHFSEEQCPDESEEESWYVCLRLMHVLEEGGRLPSSPKDGNEAAGHRSSKDLQTAETLDPAGEHPGEL